MQLSNSSVNRVSVVVVAPSSPEDMRACLNSLADQDFPAFELIVVGWGTGEGIARQLREYPFDVDHLTIDSENFCQARNAGARRANGDLLLFLRASSELPHSRTMSRIVRKFRTYDVGAGSFRLINPEDRELEWFGWEPVGNRVKGYESPVLHPAATAVRSQVFERIGGFWEPYNRVLAFKDLAARIHMNDRPVRYFPEVTIRDSDARRPFRGQLEGITYESRNQILFAVRTYPFFRCLWRVFKQFFSVGKSGGDSPGAWRARVVGNIWALMDLPSAWASRQVAGPEQYRRIIGKFSRKTES